MRSRSVTAPSFWQWPLYHKAAAAALTAILFTGLLRAVLGIGGGGDWIREETILPYAADQVWAFIPADDQRLRWQAWLRDGAPLQGASDEQGSTRTLFWSRRSRRWQSVERTEEIIPQRLIVWRQESDDDYRLVTLRLEPLGACETRLSVEEFIRPFRYGQRFWFFLDHRSEHRKWRNSFGALDRWLGYDGGSCAAQPGAVTSRRHSSG